MLILLFPLFVCWGSFLNVIAYRLVHDVNFWRARSFCPYCNRTIAWYDNIPLISWMFLKGRCRSCKAPISLLYPCIELITALCLSALFITVPIHYFPAYFIFFSALIVSVRTDLETMLISRFVTLFLLPSGIIFSAAGLIPLTYQESIAGSLFGYFLLWGVARLFFLLTKKEGLGLGDAELLAFIGSYTGIVGCWLSLLIGSVTGSFAGLIHMFLTRSNKIPFGPFLALGAMSYVLLKPLLLQFFLKAW